MITQSEAREIATQFLCQEGIKVSRFDEIRYLPEEGLWICCFLNIMPLGAVDSPGVTIVEVNANTGEASLFDAL